MRYKEFTDRVRRVVQIANQEAVRLGCNYIGPEHILLALVTEQEGIAYQVLRSLDLSLERITPLIEAVTERNAPRPRMFEVIRFAIEEADAQHHTEIDTEHLLLGLIHDRDSAALRILEGLGITCSHLRGELLARMTPGSPATEAHQRSVEDRFRDDPHVKTLKAHIRDLQRELEKAVVAMNFHAAAAFRDQKSVVAQQLKETYARLDQETDSTTF